MTIFVSRLLFLVFSVCTVLRTGKIIAAAYTLRTCNGLLVAVSFRCAFTECSSMIFLLRGCLVRDTKRQCIGHRFSLLASLTGISFIIYCRDTVLYQMTFQFRVCVRQFSSAHLYNQLSDVRLTAAVRMAKKQGSASSAAFCDLPTLQDG